MSPLAAEYYKTHAKQNSSHTQLKHAYLTSADITEALAYRLEIKRVPTKSGEQRPKGRCVSR